MKGQITTERHQIERTIDAPSRKLHYYILSNVFSDTAHGIAMGERARQLKRRTHSTTEPITE